MRGHHKCVIPQHHSAGQCAVEVPQLRADSRLAPLELQQGRLLSRNFTTIQIIISIFAKKDTKYLQGSQQQLGEQTEEITVRDEKEFRVGRRRDEGH
jgi:hypothetical protein